MSLIDRTNETIPLSIHAGPDNEIVVDHDSDSSLTPRHRIHIYSNVDGQDFGFNLTYEEAGLLHDRLGLILGRQQSVPPIVSHRVNCARCESTNLVTVMGAPTPPHGGQSVSFRCLDCGWDERV